MISTAENERTKNLSVLHMFLANQFAQPACAARQQILKFCKKKCTNFATLDLGLLRRPRRRARELLHGLREVRQQGLPERARRRQRA